MMIAQQTDLSEFAPSLSNLYIYVIEQSPYVLNL